MDIETAGAIRLFFPNPSLTLVYFEALANALDAGATDVSIDIDVQAFDKPDTLKITVSDNGDGFTDENFERFRKLLRMVFKTPVKPEWRERCAAGTMAS